MRAVALVLAMLLAPGVAAQDAPKRKKPPAAAKKPPAAHQKPSPEQIRKFNELQKQQQTKS